MIEIFKDIVVYIVVNILPRISIILGYIIMRYIKAKKQKRS